MTLRAFTGMLLALLFGWGVQAQSPAPADPTLAHRPPPKPPSFTRQGQIHLDVAVSDAQGKPVGGLQPWDFQLTDQGRPAKILSFRGFDGAVARPAPPVELILVIDEVNLPFSFNPPAGAKADEYHELKVQIAKPGMTARTNAAYYFEPLGS